MSGIFEYAAAVWSETTVAARKEHTCSACRETIPAGARYRRHVRINEPGDRPEVWKRCARCEAIYDHLCRTGGPYDQGPEPALDCGHVYDDPPDDIAALAFALPGEVDL